MYALSVRLAVRIAPEAVLHAKLLDGLKAGIGSAMGIATDRVLVIEVSRNSGAQPAMIDVRIQLHAKSEQEAQVEMNKLVGANESGELAMAWDAAGVGHLGASLASKPVLFAAMPIYFKDIYAAPPAPLTPPPKAAEGNTPPVLAVHGHNHVYISSIVAYVDAGASAHDAEDGVLAVSTTNTLPHSTPYPTGTYEVVFSTYDAFGTTVSSSRRVTVYDPCTVVDAGSRVCNDGATRYCSLSNGECVRSLGGAVPSFPAPLPLLPSHADASLIAAANAAASDAVALIEEHEDRTSPLLAFKSAPGETITYETVRVGDSWDAFADVLAIDDVDGACAAADGACTLTVFGAKRVSTKTPTNEAYRILYAATDGAGNTACCIEKHVSVVSQCGAEPVCDGGTCGVRGSCFAAGAFPLAPASVPTAATNSLPTIRLRGSSEVHIAFGMVYSACQQGRVPTQDLPCDPGAMASDYEDGDLTPFVTACGRPFAKDQLAGCNLRLDAGTFSITFAVADSSGRSASVTRRVTVLPDPTVITTSLTAVLAPPAPPAPTLILAGNDSVLRVPQHSPFGLCTDAAIETSACEPGVVATSALGVDLSAEVLACAPASCEGRRCDGFRFVNAGLRACGIDTSARVGTAFSIVYRVRDFGVSPPTAAVATRRVVIVEACADAGQYFDRSTGLCMPKAFLDLGRTATPPTRPLAVLSMRLIGDNSLTIAYGEPLVEGGTALATCSNAPVDEASGRCGAAAEARVGASKVDVSPALMRVEPAPRNVDGSTIPQAVLSLRCSIEAAGAGLCYPGTYKFAYGLNDSEAAKLASAAVPSTQTPSLERIVRIVPLVRIEAAVEVTPATFGRAAFEEGFENKPMCSAECNEKAAARGEAARALGAAGYIVYTGGSLYGTRGETKDFISIESVSLSSSESAIVAFSARIEQPPRNAASKRQVTSLMVSSIGSPPAVNIGTLQTAYANELTLRIVESQVAASNTLDRARQRGHTLETSAFGAHGSWHSGPIDQVLTGSLARITSAEALARRARDMTRQQTDRLPVPDAKATAYRMPFFRPVRALFDLHRSAMRKRLIAIAGQYGSTDTLRDPASGDATSAAFHITGHGSTPLSNGGRRPVRGFADGRGRLVGGVVLSTSRARNDCKGGDGPTLDQSASCAPSHPSPRYTDGGRDYAAYGQDPAFTLGSSWFDWTLVDEPSYGAAASETAASASATSRLYKGWNATTEGRKFPYGFQNGPNDRLPVPSGGYGFPVYFPRNLTRSRALELHTNLVDGGYVDGDTQALAVRFAVWFPRAFSLAHVTLVAERLRTGATTYRQIIEVFPSAFDIDGGSERAFVWIRAHVLEIIAIAVVAIDTALLIYASVMHVQTWRSVREKYTPEVRKLHSRMPSRMQALIDAPWNIPHPPNSPMIMNPLENPAVSPHRWPWGLAASVVCEILALSLWYTYRFEFSRLAAGEAGHGASADVYEHIANGTGRVWWHKRDTNGQGYASTSGSVNLRDFYAHMGRMHTSLSAYRVFAMLSLLLCVFRGICATSRHDSFGWYVRTATRAGSDLSYLVVATAAALAIAHVGIRVTTEASGLALGADADNLTVFEAYAFALRRAGDYLAPHAWINAASSSTWPLAAASGVGTALWILAGIGASICGGGLFVASIVHHARRSSTTRWWIDEDVWMEECMGSTAHAQPAAPRLVPRRTFALLDYFQGAKEKAVAWYAKLCGSRTVAPELRRQASERAADVLVQAYHKNASVAFTRVLSAEEVAQQTRSRWFRLGGGPVCEKEVRGLMRTSLGDSARAIQAADDAASVAAWLAGAHALAPHTGGDGSWCENGIRASFKATSDGDVSQESEGGEPTFPDVSREGRVRSSRTYRNLGRFVSVGTRQKADEFAEAASATIDTMRSNAATMRRRLRRARREARKPYEAPPASSPAEVVSVARPSDAADQSGSDGAASARAPPSLGGGPSAGAALLAYFPT